MSDRNSNRQILFDFALTQGKLMFRPAGGKLNHPFIDPGGPYSENLWDWDSYWAATALFHIAREAGDDEMLDKVRQHAQGSLLNFFEVQGKDGSLPILMSAKDVDWFDSIDNVANNMAKPVQAQFLRLLIENDAIDEAAAISLLQAIHALSICRTQRYLHRNSGLLVWANDIAIGIDDDPAVWGRPDFSSAHIYYNSFLAMDLEAATELSRRFGQSELERYFKCEYEKTVAAINSYCWDKRDKWYYSCDVQCRQNLKPHRYFPPLNTFLTPFWQILPIRIRSFSGLLPLVARIASPEQARQVAAKLLDREEFWSDYGIRTMSMAEDRFYEATLFRGNPSNWLGPIWIISSYLAYQALKNYGYDDEARQLSDNTLSLLAEDFRENQVVHEYYNPADGRPISGPGFLNWNLLALCMEK